MSGVAINRWILRRQRKILLYSVVTFIVMITYISMFQDDIKIKESHFQPFSEQCLPDSASNIINSVCRNFSNGLAFGHFCKDLCIEKTVKVGRCIHHGTTYVLIGKNRNKGIVMKVKKPRRMDYTIKYFDEIVARYASIEDIRKLYLTQMTNEIRSSFGEDTSKLFMKNLPVISMDIYGKNISHLSLAQMRASWDAVGQDELMMTVIHQRVKSFSRYVGICGPLYIIERTKSYSEYFPEVIPKLSWDKRVHIAKGFLNLIRDFQKTDVGALHHCDIQEGNFGLTDDNNVKAIDVDLVYGGNRMTELLVGADCTSNKDCEFFDCTSKCNIAERRCTSETLSNNLQVMCRDIFTPLWPMMGLLSYFKPSHVARNLSRLLERCKSEEFGSLLMGNEKVVRMMDDLENTLDVSLQVASGT